MTGLRSILVSLGSILLLAPALHAQTPATDPVRSGPLFDELARMDSILFDASFVTCSAEVANSIFTEDVEFFHDQTGMASGEQVRENTARLTDSCPGEQGVTRTVVPGSLEVYPLREYGAIQMGVHRFDERGASERTVAKFVHVWQNTTGAWRLARVLSFDHRSEPADSSGHGN